MQTKRRFLLVLPLIGLVLAFVLLNNTAQTAPHYQGTTLQGNTFDSQQLQGKVSLINFWATSCSGCVKEIPELIALQNQFGNEKFQTIGIALYYDEPAYIANFAKRFGINYPLLHDADQKIAQAFGGVSLAPTSFIVDSKGKIVKKVVGEIDEKQVQQEISSLLAAH